MRIISKFHDYYDIGMGTGHDDSIIYIREPREVIYPLPTKGATKEDLISLEMIKKAMVPNYVYELGMFWQPQVIGFCGKFYAFIQHGDIKLYSIEDVDAYKQAKERPKDYAYWLRCQNRVILNNFFKRWAEVNFLEPFIINRSPVVVLFEKEFVLGRGTIYKTVWNARLRDYGFAKVIPPYEAFQAIEMFMGNLANPEKPSPPQSDLEKVQSHGFDKKMSFRKGKGNK